MHRLIPSDLSRTCCTPTRRPASVAAVATALLALLAGCGNADSTAGAGSIFGDDAGASGGFGGGTGGDNGASGADAGSSADTNLPPETEKEVDFGAPEGSPNFVFVPVPGEDHVVKVSGSTQAVTLVEVGDRPTVIRSVPGQDAVVVINSGSDELAIVRATETKDDVRTVAILPHCNAIAVSPDGLWAIAWYDHARAQPGEPVGSFQAVALVSLGDAAAPARTLSVGFRPRAIDFTADGKRALVVTDDGVCVVEMQAAKDGEIVPPVAIAIDPLAKPAEREVRTTPDGSWAIVRQTGLSGLFAIHLPSKKLLQVPLSSVPTDLDLTPDGKLAIAVLRQSAEIAFVDLPATATPTLPTEVLSIAPLTAGLAHITDDGKAALLYSSVNGVESMASVDLETRKGILVPLRKTVDYVWLAKGAHTAVLVHKPAAGPLYDSDTTEKFVDDSQGYTLLDLDTGYTKLVLTDVAPVGIAASAVPSKAWILLPDPKNVSHKVQAAGLDTLLVTDHALGSRPLFVRPLDAAGVVAVSQQHPSGRMTFLDAKTGQAKTVTGYELNGLIK